jgi:NADP-dependent 3-hydroxy acid dehydrogenase YdfG
MSEDEDGKNGRQRLTVEREPHRVLAMGNVRTSRSEPTISSIGSPVNPMWAINCFVQTVRRQVFRHGIRVGSISPGPVISALLADWPPEKLKEAKESGSLLEASEVANVVMFMLTRPRGMTIRDVVMLPTNFDL